MNINRKWIVLAVVAVVAFILWRKFGGQVKGAISGLTA